MCKIEDLIASTKWLKERGQTLALSPFSHAIESLEEASRHGPA
jgi:hypothetical protein